MPYIEYFNHTMLVRHVIGFGLDTTPCGESMDDMLPARGEDIRRATSLASRLIDVITRRERTYLTTCYECVAAIAARDGVTA